MRNDFRYSTPGVREAWLQRGFSALEITMVASVIAIIALIALPVFLDRVQDARIKAALDEMSQIARGEQLVKADTGYYMRLQDLDNSGEFVGVSPVAPEDPNFIHVNVPSFYWNTIIDTSQRIRLSSAWKGPYMAYQQFNTIRYEDALNDPSLQNLFADPFNGPVPNLVTDHIDDELPLDPWGTPYVFFGTGQQIDVSPLVESNFHNAVIYSLGPDGLPGGNSAAFGIPNLQREPPSPGVTPELGQGDDLVYKVQ